MKLLRPSVALVMMFLTVVGTNAGALARKNKPLPFSPGESLTYNVNWSIFPAGVVTATLTSDKNDSDDAYVVTTTARSEGFVSLLYKVQDEFRSVFNPETLCSAQISKQINEGGRHKITKITFDSRRGLAILNERNVDDGNKPPKHDEHEIPPCVQDIITAFYFVRSRPLHVGDNLKLAVNDGSKTTTVVAAVTARRKIQTPLGIHEALRVEPTVFGNLYEKKKGKFVIWFSDDKYHYPLRIKASLKLGAITGTLASVTPTPAGYCPSRAPANEAQKKQNRSNLK
jgi:Protein of unknown function (DUF3108)